jgi:hypothetical protein
MDKVLELMAAAGCERGQSCDAAFKSSDHDVRVGQITKDSVSRNQGGLPCAFVMVSLPQLSLL